MNLPTLILIALNENDGQTGYQLTKQIKEKWNAFWSASHQQVYRDLGKLEQIGFATTQLEPQSGKPDRIKYSLTKEGKKHLAEVRLKELKLDVTRDKLAVLLFAANDDQAVLREHIQSFLTQCTVKQSDLVSKAQDDDINNIHQLILDKQLYEVNADIQWATQALKTFDLSEAS